MQDLIYFLVMFLLHGSQSASVFRLSYPHSVSKKINYNKNL